MQLAGNAEQGVAPAFLWSFSMGGRMGGLKHLYPHGSWSLETSLEGRPWESKGFKKFEVSFSHVPEIAPADQNLVLSCHCLLRYASAQDPSFQRRPYCCTQFNLHLEGCLQLYCLCSQDYLINWIIIIIIIVIWKSTCHLLAEGRVWGWPLAGLLQDVSWYPETAALCP